MDWLVFLIWLIRSLRLVKLHLRILQKELKTTYLRSTGNKKRRKWANFRIRVVSTQLRAKNSLGRNWFLCSRLDPGYFPNAVLNPKVAAFFIVKKLKPEKYFWKHIFHWNSLNKTLLKKYNEFDLWPDNDNLLSTFWNISKLPLILKKLRLESPELLLKLLLLGQSQWWTLNQKVECHCN
jgi:hypothetical protein